MKTSYRDVLISKSIQRHTLRSNQYRDKSVTHNVKRVLIQTYNEMKVPHLIQQRVINEMRSSSTKVSPHVKLGIDTRSYLIDTKGHSRNQSPITPATIQQPSYDEVLQAKEQEYLDLQKQKEDNPRYQNSVARLKLIASRKRKRVSKDIYERKDLFIRNSPYKQTEDFNKVSSNQSSPHRMFNTKCLNRVSSAPYTHRIKTNSGLDLSTSPTKYEDADYESKSPIHNDFYKLVNMCDDVIRDVSSARNLHQNSFRNLHRKYSKCQKRITKFEEFREFERMRSELRAGIQSKDILKHRVILSGKRRETIKGIQKDVLHISKPLEDFIL